MHEILGRLPPGSFVLDLGCARGSFPQDATAATTIRFDLALDRKKAEEICVRGDARRLPFATGAFQAVVCNHSLEHVDGLESCLREIGRIVDPLGAVYIAVPDASTLTDRLYRWLARGGGHVNPFTSPAEFAARVTRATRLQHVATRDLCSSLSFLNRRNSPRPLPVRLLFLGAGFEWSLFLYVWLSRRLDRLFNLRTSAYGWAFYFGRIAEPVPTETNVNVCIRCGSACPLSVLHQQALVKYVFAIVAVYRCPTCGATNPICCSRAGVSNTHYC